jgi:hypothetical protein
MLLVSRADRHSKLFVSAIVASKPAADAAHQVDRLRAQPGGDFQVPGLAELFPERRLLRARLQSAVVASACWSVTPALAVCRFDAEFLLSCLRR